jgi:pyruvate kinase
VYCNTRIVATIGPEEQVIISDGAPRPVPYPERLSEFARRGAGVFRINMAFHRDMAALQLLRKGVFAATAALKRPVALLADLGPKIRIDGPPTALKLAKGETLTLHLTRKLAPTREVCSVLLYDRPVPGLLDCVGEALGRRKEILISIGEDDVVLSARRSGLQTAPGTLECTVVRAGSFRGRKGLTFRHVHVRFDRYLTPWVKTQLDFLLQHGGERLAFIALSFVQSSREVLEVRDYVRRRFIARRRAELAGLGYGLAGLSVGQVAAMCAPMLIVKVETAQAVRNIEEVVLAADGIMVARGDLGLQVGVENVPAIQKEIVRMCNLLGKPVITATQMLKSMTQHATPTRAEASDAFNAVLDGSDAVMLSDETSDGPYPYQAIEAASRIVFQAERLRARTGSPEERYKLMLKDSAALSVRAERVLKRLTRSGTQFRACWQSELEKTRARDVTDRVTEAACILSDAPGVRAIVAPTTTGTTPRMLARFRPHVNCIIGAAHDPRNLYKLLLSYGIRPVLIGAQFRHTSAAAARAVMDAIEAGYIKLSDNVVVTSGYPLFVPGRTNSIRLVRCREFLGLGTRSPASEDAGQ